MTSGLVIAVDGMGGDAAPDVVVQGVDIAARRHRGVSFEIHGPPERIEPLLRDLPAAKAASRVAPCEKTIAMDVKPSQALRQGRDSSMWNAISAVVEGRAHAIVSAGNTGALMAIGMLRLRLVEGVHRPALVASWPTMRGFAAVLDVGANVTADAAQLVEFAIMGEAFHRAVYGVERPSVGFLNVGSEDQKGHEEIRGAAKLMREAGVDVAFHGFVEGDDISKGTVDVVVTDGFSGNIALKTAEGTARLVSTFLKEALTSSPTAKLGALIASPALRRLKDRMDPRTVNGGVFLGLNGVVVKSHGGADGPGFAAALNVAVRMGQSHFREEVARNLGRLTAASVAPAALAAPEAS
jgi:glycerol-3-phosphate acyltransferase PlsX